MKRIDIKEWLRNIEMMGGLSNECGFAVRYEENRFYSLHWKDLKINNFNGDLHLAATILLLIICSGACFTPVVEWYYSFLSSSSTWNAENKLTFLGLKCALGIIAFWHICLLAFALVILIDLMVYPFFTKRKEREYHACEHKVIALIRSGKPVSMETLKSASRFAFGCGTSWVSTISFSAIFISAIIIMPYSIWIVPLILIVYPSACIFLSWFFQYFFTTAEPEKECLIEALEVAERIDLFRKQKDSD